MKNYYITKINGESIKNENLKELFQDLLNLGHNPINHKIEEYSEFQEKFYIVQEKIINNYLKFLKPHKNKIQSTIQHQKKENTVKVQLGETGFLLVLNKNHSNKI
jgi:hypothetical protein